MVSIMLIKKNLDTQLEVSVEKKINFEYKIFVTYLYVFEDAL